MKKKQKGQSLVEFALVLPLLLMLLIGLAEVGFGYYDYMVLASANREGVRLASRGRFQDTAVIERIVVSGGLLEQPNGTFEKILRTTGPKTNFGAIITHIPINDEGELGSITTVFTGTIAIDGAGGSGATIRPITNLDTQLTVTDVQEYYDLHAPMTTQINAARIAAGYEPQGNEIVVVETFLIHDLIIDYGPLPLPNPVRMYFRSTMRVMRDSRL